MLNRPTILRSLLVLLLCNMAHATGFLGVHLEQKNGKVSLKNVAKESPASLGGLRANDMITRVAGVKVSSIDQLRAELAKTKAGDKLELTILRDKLTQKVTVTLGEIPKAPKREGLIDAPAPAINHITQWHNLPKGKKAINLADYKGKTVYLYCFQSWCPGCHSSGFPTMKKLIEHYKEDDSVVFLTVQTVFEGYGANTFEKGKSVLKKFGLTIPMGQDGTKKKRSGIMQNYRTGGTPWTIIISPDGTIKYSTFHIKRKDAITLIDGLKQEKK